MKKQMKSEKFYRTAHKNTDLTR